MSAIGAPYRESRDGPAGRGGARVRPAALGPGPGPESSAGRALRGGPLPGHGEPSRAGRPGRVR